MSPKRTRSHGSALPQAMFHAFWLLGALSDGRAQSITAKKPAEPAPIVSRVETYGLNRVTRASVIAASGIGVGDDLRDVDIGKATRRIEAISGVRRAVIAPVYGPLLQDGQLGLVLYLGVEEEGARSISFNPSPHGDCQLPSEIVQASEQELLAFRDAATRGQFGEDRSTGYSLAFDPKWRAAQEQFIPLAAVHWDALVEVLCSAREPAQRAIAAKVIAYSSNKVEVVRVLAKAVADSDSTVRNNATRALAVLLTDGGTNPLASISPPPALVKQLIDMLSSLQWTDRNKATSLLLAIDDNELVLHELRKRAIPQLTEMATWETSHGAMALTLLGRLSGMSHQESLAAWKKGEQQAVIARINMTGVQRCQPASVGAIRASNVRARNGPCRRSARRSKERFTKPTLRSTRRPSA